jgi:hypothetical protein
MSQDQNQDKGFSPWNGDLNKLFESLQNTDGSSQEHYNHIVSKLFGQIAGSQIFVFDTIAYILDPIRGKYLSTARINQEFSYYGQNQSSRYLKVGAVVSSGNGFLVMRDACITGVCTRSRNNQTYQLQIRKNDQITSLHTLNANAGVGIADTLDIDLDKGDYVQLFIDGNSIDHPVAFLELAWRYET